MGKVHYGVPPRVSTICLVYLSFSSVTPVPLSRDNSLLTPPGQVSSSHENLLQNTTLGSCDSYGLSYARCQLFPGISGYVDYVPPLRHIFLGSNVPFSTTCNIYSVCLRISVSQQGKAHAEKGREVFTHPAEDWSRRVLRKVSVVWAPR